MVEENVLVITNKSIRLLSNLFIKEIDWNNKFIVYLNKSQQFSKHFKIEFLNNSQHFLIP